MNDLGKLMVATGVLLIIAGAFLWSGLGRGWLGRLPGDLNYTNPRGNFSIHFPIVTCMILSLLITLLLRFFRK